MRKYANLGDVVNGYLSGELTPETAKVYLDKNEVTVTWHAPDDEDWLVAEDVFESDMHTTLEQALDLLGVPHEHA